MQNADSGRSILRIIRPAHNRHGPGLVTTDVSASDLGEAMKESMGPFIVVSLYDMAQPTFPPHPHAGFSVATYILPESPIGFINHDTLGNRNRIAPGAVHVTVAGSGVQHEEQPERAGSLARGFQIWIDHADGDRMIQPRALHLRAGDVPVIRKDGAVIRVVMGASNGAASPLKPPTPVRLVDVELTQGARFTQDLAPDENAFLVVLHGAIEVRGARAESGTVALTDPRGDLLTLSAADGPARFTLFAGRAVSHQRVQRGPFVASDAAQMRALVSRFEATGFGRLIPFAAQPGWTPNDGQTLPRESP